MKKKKPLNRVDTEHDTNEYPLATRVNCTEQDTDTDM